MSDYRSKNRTDRYRSERSSERNSWQNSERNAEHEYRSEQNSERNAEHEYRSERNSGRSNPQNGEGNSSRNVANESRRASQSLHTRKTNAAGARRPSVRTDAPLERNESRQHAPRRQSERLSSTGRKRNNAARPSVRQEQTSCRNSLRYDDEPEFSRQQASASREGFDTAAQSAHAQDKTKTQTVASPRSRAENEKNASNATSSKAKNKNALDPNLDAKARSALAPMREGAVTVFGCILVFGMILGLCFFMRPAVSKVENRELSTIDSFTLQGFLDGDWTQSVSTWYSDTFPFRDELITLDKHLESLYGLERSEQMYGAGVRGDDIPSETGTTEKKEPVAPEEYDAWNLEADIQGQLMSGLYVKDGTVYATYGFTQEAADDYANAINDAADKLDGKTKVYSILIPNNSGVLLSEDELTAMGGSNQAQAIQYYYDSYNDKVTSVETMNTLKEHKDEYLFFRTDHHWTALGAYYIYQSFCKEKGIEAHSIDDFEEEDFGNFLGSYYTELQLSSLAENPDTVQAWIPMGTNDMTYTDVDGNTIEWHVIYDVSDWDQGSQYNCFIGSDQPWSEIHNPDITDGSSCLVVKESYGNCFVPWLVDHYETVYVADYRYCNTNVVDFCSENDVDDLIILNNISIIASTDVAGKMASIL